MNPFDKTERSQTERISFELDLPHPPEKVWRALTEPALLSQWLLPVRLPMGPGNPGPGGAMPDRGTPGVGGAMPDRGNPGVGGAALDCGTPGVGGAALDLRPGAEFRLAAPPQPEWDGIVNCRVLESEEPRKLSYSWATGDLDTVVTFTLEPTGAGTWLSIVHSGFQESQKRNFGGARYGWGLMSERFVDLLAKLSVR